MRLGTSRPEPLHQGWLRISHLWPLTARSPRAPPSKRLKGRQAFSLRAPRRASPVARAGEEGDPPGIPASMTRPRWGAGEPIGTREPRSAQAGCAPGEARPLGDARARPAISRAHRHGRRVQREALVVVVPGPVQRVLQLRARTPLGLADPLLALVVHPARVTS